MTAVAGEYTVVRDLIMRTVLIFAVSVLDDCTGLEACGEIKVFLKDQKIDLIKNRSGYFLFLDVQIGGPPESKYKVRVEAAHYFPLEKTVKIADLDAAIPLVLFVLKPRPRYPFPAGMTLIRGTVSNPGPYDGAAAEILDVGAANSIDERGEFVLYLKSIPEDTLVAAAGLIKRKGGGKIKVKATAGGLSGIKEFDSLFEGAENSLGSPLGMS